MEHAGHRLPENNTCPISSAGRRPRGNSSMAPGVVPRWVPGQRERGEIWAEDSRRFAGRLEAPPKEERRAACRRAGGAKLVCAKGRGGSSSESPVAARQPPEPEQPRQHGPQEQRAGWFGDRDFLIFRVAHDIQAADCPCKTSRT